jgi:hypothetical protein
MTFEAKINLNTMSENFLFFVNNEMGNATCNFSATAAQGRENDYSRPCAAFVQIENKSFFFISFSVRVFVRHINYVVYSMMDRTP